MRDRLVRLSNTDGGNAAAPDLSVTDIKNLLTDEQLRLEFRKWFESPPRSFWSKLSSNELFKAAFAFFLTGVVGFFLTNYYATKQRELEDQRQQLRLAADRTYQERQKTLERSRAFADKLNEVRVAKIAEVWEKLCLHEAAVGRAIDSWNESNMKSTVKMAEHFNQPNFGDVLFKDPELKALADTAARDFNEMNSLALQVRDVSDKNRFWIGESAYAKIRSYLAETNRIFKTSGLAPGSQIEAKRRQARASLVEIRDAVLKE
jgi:hypothetical protein